MLESVDIRVSNLGDQQARSLIHIGLRRINWKKDGQLTGHCDYVCFHGHYGRGSEGIVGCYYRWCYPSKRTL